MNATKWETLKKCARLEPVDQVPVSLIVDSPWIPGYLGISTLDYLTIPEIWLEANLKVEDEFSEVIFLPGFWLEMGMAAEPSGFGGKTSFYHDKTPLVHPCCELAADLVDVEVPDPRTDGLMPIILNFYQYLEPQIKTSVITSRWWQPAVPWRWRPI